MKGSSDSSQVGARDAILARIRGALAGITESPSSAPVDRSYRRYGNLDREACLDLFIDRLIDYDASVLQVQGEGEVRSAIECSLQRGREQHVIVDAAFPREWLPSGLQVILDNDASIEEIESVEAVVTTCEVAVASTGTIFLKHGGAQGRRVITLLPDHHICLVRRDQVFELLPEALAVLDPSATAPITTISGPSATSDIEMTRIRGVHGPRRLTVILFGPMKS
jgi:L-lactate dehydrogenase complex protein LldG